MVLLNVFCIPQKPAIMSRFAIFFTLITGLLWACSKDNSTDGPRGPVTFGNTSGMTVIPFDTMIVNGLCQTVYEFDADNDNVMDYRLCSFNLTCGALGVGPTIGASITSLHADAQILAGEETDTLFRRFSSDTVQGGTGVEIWHRTEESCQRMEGENEIADVWIRNKAIPGYSGETLDLLGRFVADSITFDMSNSGTMPLVVYQNLDTTVYAQSIWYFWECNSIPNDAFLYLGIKVGSKPGWIKLMILNVSQILLFETAVAKK